MGSNEARGRVAGMVAVVSELAMRREAGLCPIPHVSQMLIGEEPHVSSQSSHDQSRTSKAAKGQVSPIAVLAELPVKVRSLYRLW